MLAASERPIMEAVETSNKCWSRKAQDPAFNRMKVPTASKAFLVSS